MPDIASTSLVPVMPLREVVMFPRSIMPLFVGREASMKAIEAAQACAGKQIYLVTQKEPELEKPSPEQLFPVGVICRVLQVLRLPDGTIKVLFEGVRRARWTALEDGPTCLMAAVEDMPQHEGRPEERSALVRAVHEALEEYGKINKKISQDAMLSMQALEDPGALADAVLPHLKVDYVKKQQALEWATFPSVWSWCSSCFRARFRWPLWKSASRRACVSRWSAISGNII